MRAKTAHARTLRFADHAFSFPEPTILLAYDRNRELWGQPFWNNKGNNRILPIRFHCAVCIYGACLKWLLPELSIPAAGQRDRRLFGIPPKSRFGLPNKFMKALYERNKNFTWTLKMVNLRWLPTVLTVSTNEKGWRTKNEVFVAFLGLSSWHSQWRLAKHLGFHFRSCEYITDCCHDNKQSQR